MSTAQIDREAEVIELARTPEALAAVRELFAEYAGEFAADPCYAAGLAPQNFPSELDNLPGPYAAPPGP